MIELVGQTVSTKTHGDMLIASVHPWADAFPTVRIWSISDRGLVVPVVLTPAGELVDGRSRAVSCVEAGIPIQGVVKDLTPEQARQLIVDFNVDRRALNKSQIALVAAKISVSDIELTQETLAAMFGVKQSRVSEATTIIEHSRSNAFQVLCGNMTFETALKKARDTRPPRVARPPFPPAPISPHEEPEAEPEPDPEAEPEPDPEAEREPEPKPEPVESPVLKAVPPAMSGPQTLTLAGWSAASRALLRQLETEDEVFVAGERHKQHVLDEVQARRQAGDSR